MAATDQIELVDSDCKIKQNEAQDDNRNFVKNTQVNCTSSVSDNLVANLETVIIPENQKTSKPLCYPPICQLLLDEQSKHVYL